MSKQYTKNVKIIQFIDSKLKIQILKLIEYQIFGCRQPQVWHDYLIFIQFKYYVQKNIPSQKHNCSKGKNIRQ